MPEDLFSKYVKSGKCLHLEKLDDKTKIALVKRENDYLLATSDGEEFPLSYETLDKVRDIISGNMTGLNEYESKFFERFNSKYFLKSLAKQSMLRHFEKEGIKTDPLEIFILDILFNPQFMSSMDFSSSGDKFEKQRKNKEAIERFVQENFGVKIDVDSETFTNILIKLSSDQSYEREKFMKGALKKKKD